MTQIGLTSESAKQIDTLCGKKSGQLNTKLFKEAVRYMKQYTHIPDTPPNQWRGLARAHNVGTKDSSALGATLHNTTASRVLLEHKKDHMVVMFAGSHKDYDKTWSNPQKMDSLKTTAEHHVLVDVDTVDPSKGFLDAFRQAQANEFKQSEPATDCLQPKKRQAKASFASP